ncbi:hypothetical protein OIO90_002715 [Microbotryomycetes sp. JL221]|nr:hypothetical protein OIO90_002715 [Microbotryomycetes sp. JL221]
MIAAGWLTLAVLARPARAASFSQHQDVVLSNLYSEGVLGKSPYQQYHSSNATPPAFNNLKPKTKPKRSRKSNAAENDTEWYTFIGARGADTHDPAPYIYDDVGELVWQGPLGNVMNFGKHKYKGRDVLAWYTGTEHWPGYGEGQWQIYDNKYQLIATVEAQNTTRNMTDPHDFQITADDTAVIEYWIKQPINLKDIDGPSEGWAYNCVVQEIDIENGNLLFEWSMMDHISVTESDYVLRDGQTGKKDGVFDFAHLNSVKKDDAGNFLVGMRGPSTLYYVDGRSGEILWRLGGHLSDFSIDKNASFFAQHDARIIGKGTDNQFLITLFDNEANQYKQREGEAKGLILDVDRTTMKVHLKQAFYPTFKHVAPSEGSMQILSNGHVVVGWGIVPAFSEYLSNGTLIHDVEIGPSDTRLHSYRTRKERWVGNPQTLPSFVIDDIDGDKGFASWNGATEVTRWKVLGGNSQTSLHTLEAAPRSGFETTLRLPDSYEFYAVAAVGFDGKCLTVSETRRYDTLESIGNTMSCQKLLLEDLKRDTRMLLPSALILTLVMLACRRGRRTPMLLVRQAVADRGVYTPLLGVPPTPSPLDKDDMFSAPMMSSRSLSSPVRSPLVSPGCESPRP